MEIFTAHNKFHVTVEGKVLGSFSTEHEAEAFKASCIKGEMKELTPEEKDRLLTIDQVLEGESLEPTNEGNFVSPVTHSDSPTIEVKSENDVEAVEEESTL